MSQKELLAHIVHDYLESEKFDFKNLDPYSFFVDGLLKMRTCGFSFGVKVDDYGISAEFVCPVKATSAVAAAVAEYIVRVNNTLKTGCYTFRYESGTVGYRNYLPCEEEPPSIADLEYAIQYPLCAIHKYQSGLANLLTGCGTASACFEKAARNTISYQAKFSENLGEV